MRIPTLIMLWISFLMSFNTHSQSQGSGRDSPLSYDPPGATDTRSRDIQYVTKRTFSFNERSLWVSNEFSGSRLNELVQLNDSTFSAIIRPENTPVNMSPWYAFKLWSQTRQHIHLRLMYEAGRHRYYPKISRDGRNWQPLDSASFVTENESATLLLPVSPDTIWVAAQEMLLPHHTYSWTDSLARLPYTSRQVIGYSTLNQPIVSLQIRESDGKNLLVVLSRQHPPEVTGYLAMRAFVETIAGNTELARQFRKRFETVVIPLMNPDGVLHGHWRHNAGGVDLNRDWLHFRQPETAAVRDYLTKKVKQQKARIRFALDFHSTWNDIYYVFNEQVIPRSASIAQPWLAGIEQSIPGYRATQEAFGLDSPISKNWFFSEFGADAVTYEVGDNTPRPELRERGRIAAEQLMRVLLENRNNKGR
jgi:cytosolic carboxypeptidase protein 6